MAKYENQDVTGLAKMGFHDAYSIHTGTKGECALCEHTLAQVEIRVWLCRDCHAVYYQLDTGLLDYVGRLSSETRTHSNRQK